VNPFFAYLIRRLLVVIRSFDGDSCGDCMVQYGHHAPIFTAYRGWLMPVRVRSIWC